MRDLLKRIFIKIFLDSEKSFLREQVKDLQLQVIILAGKNQEYINTKMAQSYIPKSPVSVDSITGGLVNQVETPKTEEEKKQYEMAQQELREMYGVI